MVNNACIFHSISVMIQKDIFLCSYDTIICGPIHLDFFNEILAKKIIFSKMITFQTVCFRDQQDYYEVCSKNVPLRTGSYSLIKGK